MTNVANSCYLFGQAVARVPLRGGFVADREVADSGLCPSFGFVALRATTHSWPEGYNHRINPENGSRTWIIG